MSEPPSQEPPSSTPAAATSVATSAAPSRRRPSMLLVARIIATVGVVLFAVGNWMPWRVVSGYTFVGNQQQDYTLALSPGDVAGAFGSFVWSALTVVGLLLLPLLWWRSQPVITYVVLRLNTVLVVMSGVLSLPTGLSSGDFVRLVPELKPDALDITQHGPWILGFWMTLVGVVLMTSSAMLSILLRGELSREMRQGESTSGETAARPRVALPGASALTIGLALWAVSTFVMPWASVDCSTTPLFFGTCRGLPYSTVLRFGIADATRVIDPLVAQYAVGVLLGGGAVMILAGLWWRARSVAFCGWATLWVVVAAGFAWLAEDGVGVVVAQHEALGLPAGTWVGENAVLITLLGFVLALVGLAYLWVDVVRNRDRREGSAGA